MLAMGRGRAEQNRTRQERALKARDDFCNEELVVHRWVKVARMRLTKLVSVANGRILR